MNTDPLNLVDEKIAALISDKTKYSFEQLKQKVEEILKNVDIFMVEDELNSKAVDLYLKNVITKRNNIQKEQDKSKIDNSKETRFALIEAICKKYDFTSQEELIKKIDELKKKTNFELDEINNSL
ncbi:hypothetical protein [Arcobacter roscoffensis]|uniref:Uncharacterized protein n=1 Tax=Arcobacter roscoffensis TaxID=2961520 RepID=A0ABY5E6G5_9BACT|nr:hypothetical protein [Arcobacter roscoffensis]UTJ07769.1 hypothetical protein NJU99_06645 [Arcobacter roscoffensis]